MAEIVYSPQALEDLIQTKAYITEELSNEQAARNLIAGIMKQIKQLGHFPQSGPSLNSAAGFDTDYRFLICGSYMVFYRADPDKVYIVRVLYGKRDYMRILFGTPDVD